MIHAYRRIPSALGFLLLFTLFSRADEALKQPTMAEVEAVKQFIHASWPRTFHSANLGNFPLPAPYSSPGVTRFTGFYYWDTYFTSLGVIRDGHQEIARGNAEDMMYLIETMGYVPNGNDSERNRSQPPVGALQIQLCLEFVKDRAWHERAYAALEKEYGTWMAFRAFPDGLNHYGSYATPRQENELLQSCRSRLDPTIPEKPVARQKFAAHVMAVAESGWDFTPRWGDHCQEYASVDLNSLLLMTERVEADLAGELANGRERLWRERLEKRQSLMNRLLWDDQRGLYVDYDESTGQRSSFISAASYFPLFCGVANSHQAERSIQALAGLETDYGVDTCLPGKRARVYQWDSPNLWPPLQWVVVSGLQQSGHPKEARRLALKYVTTVVRNFQSSGQLWEKYNARTGKTDVAGEYKMVPMLGWTAGVFLACSKVAGY